MAQTKSEALVMALKTKQRDLNRALREAGSPERMGLTGIAGGGGAILLAQLASWALTKPLAKADKTGIFGKYPEVTKGGVIAAAGAAITIGNLVMDYSYPMDAEREGLHIGGIAMGAIGFDRMIRNWPEKAATAAK